MVSPSLCGPFVEGLLTPRDLSLVPRAAGPCWVSVPQKLGNLSRVCWPEARVRPSTSGVGDWRRQGPASPRRLLLSR